MHKATLLLVSLLIAPPANLAAQQDSLLSTGARVRLWAPKFKIFKQVATVVTVDADTLTLNIENRVALLALPTTSVKRLEMSRGKRSRAWVGAGAGLGFLAGAVIGGVIGDAALGDAEEYDFLGATLVAAVGGPIGALIGVQIGVIISDERWEQVPLPIRIGLLLQHREGRIGLSTSFFF